jgi:DHA2 family methylenomycin A resistance protein-like MFS transporter
LVVSATALFALPSFEGLVVISAILGVQGAAYGVYLTSGNMYVNEEAPPEQRGTAMGVYSTFSNVSGVLSPLILGAASEAWGFRGAFWASSALALCGTAVVLALSRKGKESLG